MVTIEHRRLLDTMHHVVMKTKDLTVNQIASVPCPTCGAAKGEVCELHTGFQRFEPHKDRRLSAADAVEKTKRGGKVQYV